MGKNKKRQGIILIMISLVIICIILLYHQKGKMSLDGKYKKVIIIGIDGMDPGITNKLFDEGTLPNFKRLSESGSFINLNTSYPPHSPVAWTSIATGTNPGKHNIFDFIRRNPDNYLPVLSLSKTVSGIAGTDYEPYVKADPFWRLTTRSGIPTTVIRWPVTFPPERIEGNLLAGLGVPDVRGFLSGYSFYTTKELSKEDEESNKAIRVTEENGIIATEIRGPRTKQGGEIVDIKSDMEIEIQNNGALLSVSGKEYKVIEREWSEWIRVKFRIGTFKKVYGIFKAYLISTDPFEMYVTTIQIDPVNPMTDISAPKDYSGDLANDIGLYYTLGMPEETDGYINDKIDSRSFLAHVTEIEAERDRMFWEEFNNFKKLKNGVFAFVYDSSDRVQHVYWDHKLLDQNDTELSVNKVVVGYFSNKDKFIGEVLKQIDENTLLLIVSDHGFTSFERAVSINRWLVENGFMTLTKEIGDEEAGLFKYVDWSKTEAYSLGFNSIYINVKGREGKGIVEDRKRVVEEIIEKLENLIDKKTGKRVVNKAYRREEVYTGDYVKDGPDIIIGFNPGFRMAWQTAVGGFTKEVVYDNEKKWDGDHLVDPKFVPGVLFSNIKINKDSASQMDVAPTILDALGMEIPEDMDGKSLLE